MHAHSFLGLQKGLHGQRCEGGGGGGGEELMLLQHNTRPHTSAAISAATESIRFEVVPRPPCSPDLVLSDFWLFGVSKTHLKGNRSTHDAQVPSCYGKMVSRKAWKILHWQVWKTCSELAALFEWGGLHGNVMYRKKIHNLGYILCFVTFRYLVWM